VTARIYECRITHARVTPLRNVFSYGSYLWLVDLDDLPRPWLLAAFRARDHLGDPRRSIRENLDRFLAARGVDLDGARILMLAHARVLGYVFNPLTVYWCHRADGSAFTASVRGRGVPATRRALIAATVRRPWPTAAVSARIRWQGVRLASTGHGQPGRRYLLLTASVLWGAGWPRCSRRC